MTVKTRARKRAAAAAGCQLPAAVCPTHVRWPIGQRDAARSSHRRCGTGKRRDGHGDEYGDRLEPHGADPCRTAITLAGLPPGEYKVDVSAERQDVVAGRRVAGRTDGNARSRRWRRAGARQLESVTVSATRLFETKTSEVASYVSLKQIELLPQSSRNFLQFADTVPGMQFVTEQQRLNGTCAAARSRRMA